jgi:DNA replication and repair protein RecF
MHLTHLSLTDYRAFTRLDMDVPRRVLVLVGANAQGKTSVLEAIYYLATFNSFHTHTDRQLINFMASERSPAVARVVAGFQKGSQAHRLEVRLILDNGGGGGRFRREILLDGVKRSATEALGAFNAVIFLPQMTRIIDGEPEERRRYLNLALAQAQPGYAQALSEYEKALAQRNALLRLLAERGGDAGQLRTWDELLAERGALIIQARIAAVQEMERLAARLHHRLTHAQEVLRVVYQPAYDPLTPPAGQYALPIQTTLPRGGFSRDQIRLGFLQRLEALRSEEIARGVTTCGPHRDELRFLSNGVDLGDYGSRGQVRTALMALKLAEMAWLKERTGQWPVLLLDEILAELDLQRRADLLAALAECEQAILTTTDLGLFAGPFMDQTTIWQVIAGRVENHQPAGEG